MSAASLSVPTSAASPLGVLFTLVLPIVCLIAGRWSASCAAADKETTMKTQKNAAAGGAGALSWRCWSCCWPYCSAGTIPPTRRCRCAALRWRISTALAYAGNNEDVTLVKGSAGDWMLESDPTLPLDQTKTASLVESYANLTAQRKLEGSDLAELPAKSDYPPDDHCPRRGRGEPSA